MDNDVCVVCSKPDLIPNKLTCGHIICNVCIRRDALSACSKCFQPIHIKFTFQMPLTESPTLVTFTSNNGATYSATVLLHGSNYNKFLESQRAAGNRVVDSCETRLEYDQFLKWKQERRLNRK